MVADTILDFEKALPFLFSTFIHQTQWKHWDFDLEHIYWTENA